MTLKDMILVSLEVIWANKLRSALTILGIIIGVMVVILIVTLGISFKEQTTAAALQMGSNSFTLYPSTNDIGQQGTLTLKECDFIKNSIDSVELICPLKYPDRFPIIQAGTKKFEWITTGVGADYPKTSSLKLASGRFFNHVEDDMGKRVVVISDMLSNRLFGPDSNAVGKTININGTPFMICGVSKPEDQIMGLKLSNTYIPIKTMLEIENTEEIDHVVVRIKGTESLQAAINRITKMMELRQSVKNGFAIQTNKNIIERSNKQLLLVISIFGAIAGISLVVGGIGIMNVMMLAVTERTREIGVRISVGANRRDILMQFLVETAVTAALGGSIGMLLGVGLGALMCSFLNMPVIISWQVIAGAFIFSSIIGLIFGILPAKQATKLDPIDVLRFE